MFIDGREIRRVRKQAGIAQKRLARMVGSLPIIISRLEGNRMQPTPELLNAIARSLGVKSQSFRRDGPLVHIGEVIRNARKSRKITQTQFAELVGCCLDTVCNTERGESLPRRKLAELMAGALDLDISGLAVAEEPKGPPTNRPGYIGEAIRRARLARHLTQEELADLTGLSSQSICRIERGQSRKPRKSTLALMAKYLGDHLAGPAREWNRPSRDLS